MTFSPERRACLTYLTESQASDGTTKRSIIVESRPQYAVLQLEGTNIRYSVAWERIFNLAKTNQQRNRRCEAAAAQKFVRGRLRYLTESQASDGTAKRPIIVESRPQYAVLRLQGTNIRYSVAWERIFAFAKTNTLARERRLRAAAAPKLRLLRRQAAAQKLKFLRRKKASH